jgi:hypothetical protein
LCPCLLYGHIDAVIFLGAVGAKVV